MAKLSTKTIIGKTINLDQTNDSQEFSEGSGSSYSTKASPLKKRISRKDDGYYTTSTDDQSNRDDYLSESDVSDFGIQTPKIALKCRTSLLKPIKNKRVSDYHCKTKSI